MSLLGWIIAVPLSVALAMFSFETLLGLFSLKPIPIEGIQPRTFILMPAHDEDLTISATLEELKPVLSDRIKLLVVADNCNDTTAKIVRDHGYDVIERSNAEFRGKGHALAFGREYLRPNPPDCVIVFDADCTTDKKSIGDLSKHCIAHNVPVQAQYVLCPNKFAGPMVQISNFAFWVKNAVRQRGGQRLGGAAVLTGTGMAFPWKVFENLPLASSNIVEDLELAIHLIRTGHAPIYLDQALIKSLPAGEQATLDQRTRWEHGFITMARQYGLKAMMKGITGGNRKLFQMGLHLLVPPVALLFGLSLFGIAYTALLTMMVGNIFPFILISCSLFLAISAIFFAWLYGGKEWISGPTLFKLPTYVIWKIPLYWKLIRGKTPSWNRTER